MSAEGAGRAPWGRVSLPGSAAFVLLLWHSRRLPGPVRAGDSEANAPTESCWSPSDLSPVQGAPGHSLSKGLQISAWGTLAPDSPFLGRPHSAPETEGALVFFKTLPLLVVSSHLLVSSSFY